MRLSEARLSESHSALMFFRTPPEQSRIETKHKRAGKARFLRALKLTSGCIDCGYREDPDRLSFDHRDGTVKDFNISDGVRQGWWRLCVEIEKCDVRCLDCHANRHHTAEGLDALEGASLTRNTRPGATLAIPFAAESGRAGLWRPSLSRLSLKTESVDSAIRAWGWSRASGYLYLPPRLLYANDQPLPPLCFHRHNINQIRHTARADFRHLHSDPLKVSDSSQIVLRGA